MGGIHAERRGTLLVLQLRHAGRANAIDGAMLDALEAQVGAVEADPGVRLVVLRGTAGGTFSSGADIGAWGAMSPDAFARDWIGRGNRLLDRLERLRCPTVAAIEGLCLGGGLELALCCDLRVGSTEARFAFPEAGIGAVPGWKGGQRLARVAGRGRALQAVLTGQPLDAATALAWGVLNAAAPPDAFEAELSALTRRLLAVSPHAAAVAKSSMLDDDPSDDALQAAARRVRGHADAEEGLRAFREKRPAHFQTQ